MHGSAKKKANKDRLVATNVMEHPLLHHFDANPSFNFGSQNNVAALVTNQPTLVLLFFRTVIPTSLNNFCNCFLYWFALIFPENIYKA